MPDFEGIQQGRGAPDPTKHVRYSRGMVLGVDDLTQEFTYHSARDRWIVRDLLGFGVVRGLKVSVHGHEVSVEPGVAVSPSGQLVRVNVRQIGSLLDWLNRHADVRERVEKDASARVHVVLGYAERLTDPVPIPAEPAFEERRSHEEASRIEDHFSLRFSVDPGWQAAAGADPTSAGRERVSLPEWLRKNVQVVPSGQDELAQMLGELARISDSASALPQPQPGTKRFRIRVDQVPEAVRAASALWVTPRASDPPVPGGDDDQLLLATIQLGPGFLSRRPGHAESNLARAEMRCRPALLNLSFFQEWLLDRSKAEHNYRTVAAGIVYLDKTPTRTLGGLRVTRVNTKHLERSSECAIELTFDEYDRPQQETEFARHVYVVKVLPWNEHAPHLHISVVLQAFEADHLVLRMSRVNGPMSLQELERVRLMVEVSQLVLPEH